MKLLEFRKMELRVNLSIARGTSMALLGPSLCGKTTFFAKLFENETKYFGEKVPHVILHLASMKNQPQYEHLKSILKDRLTIIYGLPNENFDSKIEQGSIICYDDLIHELMKIKDNYLEKLVSKYTSRLEIRTFVLSQLFFSSHDDSLRIFLKNVTYATIFTTKIQTRSMVGTLSRQYFGSEKILTEIFDKFRKEGLKYFIINFDVNSPSQAGVFYGIFADESPKISFEV